VFGSVSLSLSVVRYLVAYSLKTGPQLGAETIFENGYIRQYEEFAGEW
jgi:hypothetical protein